MSDPNKPNMPNLPKQSEFRKSQKGRRPPMNNQPNNNWLFWTAIVFVVLVLMSQSPNMAPSTTPSTEMTYSDFYAIVKDNKTTNEIKKLELIEGQENILMKILEFHHRSL